MGVLQTSLAYSELRRDLKVGGYVILQTLFSNKLTHTSSDPGIDSNSARYQANGRENRMRLYGSGIVAGVEFVSLGSRVATHDEVLADFDPLRFGVNRKEPFLQEFEPVPLGLLQFS